MSIDDSARLVLLDEPQQLTRSHAQDCDLAITSTIESRDLDEFHDVDDPTPPPATPPLTIRLFKPPHLFNSTVSPMEPYETVAMNHGSETTAIRWSVVFAVMAVCLMGFWTNHALRNNSNRIERQLAFTAEHVSFETTRPLPKNEPRVEAEVFVQPIESASSAKLDIYQPHATPQSETTRDIPDIQLVRLDESTPAIRNALDTNDPTSAIEEVKKLVMQDSGESALADETESAISPALPAKACESAGVCRPQRKLDTAITWADSVDEAAMTAEVEEKLVFLIHVSGNFAIEEFT
jgi:hypothetical protein